MGRSAELYDLPRIETKTGHKIKAVPSQRHKKLGDAGSIIGVFETKNSQI
jgi:hypothetical protein